MTDEERADMLQALHCETDEAADVFWELIFGAPDPGRMREVGSRLRLTADRADQVADVLERQAR